MTSLPAEETEVGRSSTQRSEKSCGMPWKIYDRALKEYERRKAMAEEPTTEVTLYPIRVTVAEIAERFGVIPTTIHKWKLKREQGWTRDDFLDGFRTTGTDIF